MQEIDRQDPVQERQSAQLQRERKESRREAREMLTSLAAAIERQVPCNLPEYPVEIGQGAFLVW